MIYIYIYVCIVCLVYDSFKDYVSVESLDGDNRYDAGDYGLQVGVTCSFITVQIYVVLSLLSSIN